MEFFSVIFLTVVLSEIVILKDYFVTCSIQQFSKPPTDVEIPEGQDITLPCQVSNQVGSVQWSKSNTLLGFDPQVPGFPRYTIAGNTSIGIHDLTIKNVSIEDDADFECQVSPAEGQESMVAKAHLTVLLPPTSIQVIGKQNGSTITANVLDNLSLECEVKGGKPAPKVLWYRDYAKMPEDAISTSIKDETEGRQTIVGTLRITPTSDDNGIYYHCEAQTSFESLKISAGVTLDVLYTPSRPIIEGYRPRDKIRALDTVRLKCSSRGGNPMARLVWTKNGQPVDHSYTSSSSDGETVNEVSFTATPSDDGAVYACAASSRMTTEPMVRAVTLQVLYSPSSVSIKAPKEAKAGDTVSATCKTEKSNPVSEITWVVDGVPLEGSSSVVKDSNGGWVTTSSLNVNVTNQDRNSKQFICYAVNRGLGETVHQIFSVSILYAPDTPNIFGYTHETPIQAGKLQRLSCISHGGNPLPDLKWYKNGKELKTAAQTTNGNIISRELAIIVEANDNKAQYQCKSTSKALSEPLVASLNLTVYFPPDSLQLKVKPKKPKAGSEIKLICESAVSNPAANISWWKGGKEEEELVPLSVTVTPSGDGDGFVTKATVALNVSAEDDGAMCACRATNEAIQQSVHDTIFLSVFYKPIFSFSEKRVFEVKENDSWVVNMTAMANPNRVAYEWKKGDAAVAESSGPLFNITAVERTQTGEYACKAVNEIGETSVVVVLQVLYPAAIIRSGEDEKEETVVLVEPESNVRLTCSADGYPMKDDTLQWKRDGFDMKAKTEVLASGNGKSILGLKNVSREYSGEFLCVADNGIGSPDTGEIVLLVKHQPSIRLGDNSTVHSDRGVSAKLFCTAEGIPDVAFTWTLEGQAVVGKDTPRVRHDVVKLSHFSWRSILTIDDVQTKDFGEYKCVARNEVGFETADVALCPDGPPDPPLIVRITNTTRTSLQVSWVAGFGGGHNQTHRVRYRAVGDPAFRYVDVHPPAADALWLTGLRPAVEYEVAMKSVNVRGDSPYSTAVVKAVTTDTFQVVSKDTKYGMGSGITLVELLVGTIGTVFFLLMGFNIILMALYCHKKEPKMRRKYSEASVYSSSDLSESSSHVESEETTFSVYSSDTLKDRSTPSDAISLHYSDSVSESYEPSFEDETITYSQSSSPDLNPISQGFSEFV